MLRRVFIVAATAAAVVGCRDQVSPTGPLALRRASFVQFPSVPVVNSLADDGNHQCTDVKCTLRDAIAFAQAGATITFNVTGTIALTQGPLFLLRSVTIQGPGASNLAVDGGGAFQLLLTTAATTVSVSGLTLQHGVGGGGLLNAGGIVNEATMTITNSVITDNHSPFVDDGAGGIWNGNAALTLVNTTVSNNSAGYAGGGIVNEGTLTLDGSTVANNSAQSHGGGILNEGTLTVRNSTIVGNHAGAGGGILNEAGSIAVITNSTLTGNGSSSGAGVANGGTLSVMSTTIASNFGPGISTAGSASVQNTIVANNNGPINCDGAITDGGYNVEGGEPFHFQVPHTCAFSAVGSQSVMDAKLGALADNGGPTKTMALLSGSPAKDQMPPGINGCGTSITTDQRGVTRPQRFVCDIGAVEMENQLPVASVGGPYAGIMGTAVTLTMSGSDADGDALKYKWDLGDGTTSDGIIPPPGSHVYAQPGTYTISLTVGDNVTVSDEQTTTVTIANNCVVGFYYSAPDCVPAPRGTYVNFPHATSATVCPSPWSTAFTGATSASQCNLGSTPGNFRDVDGMIKPCPAGTYQFLAVRTSCFQAPPGSYAPGGDIQSIPCPAGTYQPQSAQASCLPSPAGSFSGPGATHTTFCSAGSYQPATGQSFCILASAGSYVPFVGATAQTPCPAGTYSSFFSSINCTPAPVGTYVPAAGSSFPTNCPAGTTTLAVGATSVSQCVQVIVNALTLGDAKLWIGLKNSDAVGLRLDLRAEVLLNGIVVGSGDLPNVPAGSSGFNNAVLRSIALALVNPSVPVPSGATLTFRPSVRRTCFGTGHTSGTVRFWYDGPAIDAGSSRNAGSRFAATVGGVASDYFARNQGGLTLATTAGTLRQSVDVTVNSSAACPARPFASLGEWSVTLQ